MNQPLRTVHRRTFLGLGVILPAVLITGLAARRPRVEAAAVHTPQISASAQLVRKSDTLWPRHKIQTMLYRVAEPPHKLYVALHPMQSVNEPDPLLYWSFTAPAANEIPPEAQLIGSFKADTSIPLPLDERRAGYLVLYSGAHQAVIDFATVETLP